MRTISAIAEGVALLAGVFACRAGSVDAAMVQQKIQAGALVVDVRTPGEFAAGAYPGATNIPLDQIAKRLADFGDRKRAVVVYCRSGNRSAQAKIILEKNGFSSVSNGGALKDMPPR
jgi:rhodanese-related sulfurtransferase